MENIVSYLLCLGFSNVDTVSPISWILKLVILFETTWVAGACLVISFQPRSGIKKNMLTEVKLKMEFESGEAYCFIIDVNSLTTPLSNLKCNQKSTKKIVAHHVLLPPHLNFLCGLCFVFSIQIAMVTQC